MKTFKSINYAEEVVRRAKCSPETKEFLLKALRMEYNSSKTLSNKTDYFRLLRDVIEEKLRK